MRKHEKRTAKERLIILVMLLDDVALLALVIWLFWFLKVELPLPVMVVILLLFGSFIFITHEAVISSLHKKKITGSEGMIGLEGKVIKPLKPVGVIRVENEYWKAKSVGEDIEAGEDVEILVLNRLTLEVKRKSQNS